MSENYSVEQFVYDSLDGVIDLEGYTVEEVYQTFVGFNKMLGNSEEDERAKFDNMIAEDFHLPTVIKMMKPAYTKIFSDAGISSLKELEDQLKDIMDLYKK